VHSIFSSLGCDAEPMFYTPNINASVGVEHEDAPPVDSGGESQLGSVHSTAQNASVAPTGTSSTQAQGDEPRDGTSPTVREHPGDTPATAARVLPQPSEHILAPGSCAPDPPRPKTRLQSGMRKPKVYTDGTIKYGCFTTSGEPHSLDEALNNKNWKDAIDIEYMALMKNKTWHLVSPQKEEM
jgi:hypothetical protein